MARAFVDIAFTPSVRARQSEEGSRQNYAPLDAPDIEPGDRLTQFEADFISMRDGFYQATVSETGWPYVQFRGGAPGFLKVIDAKTIGYADFRGNRQYISSGNLTLNDRVSLILMDYPNRLRLKIWARATQVKSEDDKDLIERLRPKEYRGQPERAILLAVEGFDWNCPAHIPQRFTQQELAPAISKLHEKLAELETENAELKAFMNSKK